MWSLGGRGGGEEGTVGGMVQKVRSNKVSPFLGSFFLWFFFGIFLFSTGARRPDRLDLPDTVSTGSRHQREEVGGGFLSSVWLRSTVYGNLCRKRALAGKGMPSYCGNDIVCAFVDELKHHHSIPTTAFSPFYVNSISPSCGAAHDGMVSPITRDKSSGVASASSLFCAGELFWKGR